MPIGFSVALATLVVYAATYLWSSFQQRRRRRRLMERLAAEWGRRRTERRASADVGFYHFTHAAGLRGSIDRTTWTDLNLDEVFDYFDRTQSVLGREVLYSRLRETDAPPEDRRDFDALVRRLAAASTRRLELQTQLARIAERSATTAWQLALEAQEHPPRWMSWGIPAAALCVAAAVGGTALNPAVIAVTVPAFLLVLFLRVRIAWRIAPWTAPLLSVGQALGAAECLAVSEPVEDPTTRVIRESLPALRGLGRLAWWMGRDPSRTDLGAMAVEYLNWFFNLDGLAMLLADREIRRRREVLRRLLEALGRLDAAAAVASVRAAGGWCEPRIVDARAPVRMIRLTHPLVANCVPNSLTLGPADGVILTGANMTGKSTFLRTIGVNAVLAQTVNMAFAEEFDAPRMTVRSCIDAADSLIDGKSLYQAEAETVVSLLSQPAKDGAMLCLFDELFRGTNSVDRIAASAAVYSSLAAPSDGCRRLVIAATHDLELVSALDGQFSAYHFGDRIASDRLEFDYTLRPGVAPSRNAIALLQILGAPTPIIEDAYVRARRIESQTER
jgi:hypothetical protein